MTMLVFFTHVSNRTDLKTPLFKQKTALSRQGSVGILPAHMVRPATAKCHSYHTACHVLFLQLGAKLTAQERHFGSYIRCGASTRRAPQAECLRYLVRRFFGLRSQLRSDQRK